MGILDSVSGSPERLATESYLLALASRLSSVKCVVVLAMEDDGRFTNYQANYCDVPWANVAGNLAAIQLDMLANKLHWEGVALDGSPIKEEEP